MARRSAHLLNLSPTAARFSVALPEAPVTVVSASSSWHEGRFLPYSCDVSTRDAGFKWPFQSFPGDSRVLPLKNRQSFVKPIRHLTTLEPLHDLVGANHGASTCYALCNLSRMAAHAHGPVRHLTGHIPTNAVSFKVYSVLGHDRSATPEAPWRRAWRWRWSSSWRRPRPARLWARCASRASPA